MTMKMCRHARAPNLSGRASAARLIQGDLYLPLVTLMYVHVLCKSDSLCRRAVIIVRPLGARIKRKEFYCRSCIVGAEPIAKKVRLGTRTGTSSCKAFLISPLVLYFSYLLFILSSSYKCLQQLFFQAMINLESGRAAGARLTRNHLFLEYPHLCQYFCLRPPTNA